MEKSILDEKLTLVSFKMSQFSGYRRATREFIARMGGKLPACKSITEGSIKIFPADGLRGFNAIRRNLSRYLQSIGVQALGSSTCYAVPASELLRIEAKVSKIEAEFQAQKNLLWTNYEQVFDAHVQSQENPAAAEIIQSLKLRRDDAVSKCNILFNVFRIRAVARKDETEEESVEGITRGLTRRLYEEVALEMAKLSISDSFERLRVGQKTLGVLRAALAKMERLAFLDDSIEHAVKFGKEVLAMMPKSGFIEGQPFEVLSLYVESSADPDKILNAALSFGNGKSALDILCKHVPLQTEACVQIELSLQEVKPQEVPQEVEPLKLQEAELPKEEVSAQEEVAQPQAVQPSSPKPRLVQTIGIAKAVMPSIPIRKPSLGVSFPMMGRSSGFPPIPKKSPSTPLPIRKTA